MYPFVNILALLVVTCGHVYGDEVPIVTTEAPPAIFNQNDVNRNPLIPGNINPYYNSPNVRVPILSYSSNQGVDGSYSFSFSTADGKQAQENGFLKDAYIDEKTGEPQATQVKEGSFSYTSPEGIPIQVTYVADENGYRPAGIHFSADGKGILPGPVNNPLPALDAVKGSQAYDPRYNFYNPYNRNRFFGQYNNYNQYDGRYPNDPRYDYLNPYRFGAYNQLAQDQVKKEVV